MFGNMKDMASMMKMASQAKEHMEQLQAELERKTVMADAGAGAVKVHMNGKFRVLKIELDPHMLASIAGEDKQMIEDLIAAAVNAAHEKVQKLIQEEMGGMMGGMNLPGLGNMLGGLGK